MGFVREGAQGPRGGLWRPCGGCGPGLLGAGCVAGVLVGSFWSVCGGVGVADSGLCVPMCTCARVSGRGEPGGLRSGFLLVRRPDLWGVGAPMAPQEGVMCEGLV